MAVKTLNTRIVNKHDTSTNWEKAVNFKPKAGEIIIYDYDGYNKIKIGDGQTVVSDLPFVEQDLADYVTTSTLTSTISATVSSINKTIDILEEEVNTNTTSIQQLISSVMDYEDLGTI